MPAMPAVTAEAAFVAFVPRCGARIVAAKRAVAILFLAVKGGKNLETRPYRPAQRIALGGIVAALTIVFLLLGSFMPSGRMGFLFVSSLFIAALAVEKDWVLAGTVYIAAALLAIFVLPNKGVALLYAAFFGYYGILRIGLENVRSKTVRWICKYVVFNIVLVLVAIFAIQLFVKIPIETWMWIVGFIGAQAVFGVYDWLYGQLTLYYMKHLRPRIGIGRGSQ